MSRNSFHHFLFTFLAAALLAPGAARAAEYVPGNVSEIVLMAGSADGMTNTLAEAIAAYNSASNTSYTVSSFNGGDLAAYALIKEGDGTLVMDTAITGFTGPVVINDGVLKCDCTGALGADTTSSHVYVRDGATFYVKRIADSDDIKNTNRNLHIAGEGHNGQGALNVDKSRKSNVYNAVGIYGKVLYLDGNATAVHPSWAVLASPVYLNGYTLTVKSADSFSATQSMYCNATFQAGEINGPGKMVIDDSIYYLSGTKLNDSTPGNELEIRDNGAFRFWKGNYTGFDWIIRFTGATAWFFGDNHDGRMRFNLDGSASGFYNAARNRIGSPMILEGTTLKMRTQSGIPDNWVFLTGPISGNGNINLECESWTFPAARLSLLNPENSFTGTATVDKGLLYVYEPGTLPSTVPIVVSRSHALDYKLQKTAYVPEYFGVEFLSPNPQTLNSLTFMGVTNKDNRVYQSGRIQGGCGTFSRIDKLSPNTMEYYSGIGSPLLNVEGGTVKLPRGPAPGLWEGTNKAEIVTGDSNWTAILGSRMVATNLIARGPLIANFPLFPHFAAKLSAPTTYSGYIWNRYGQDVTVTLVSSTIGYTRLFIDDALIIQQNTYSGAADAYDQVFANLTLTTGPHKFEYRVHSGGTLMSNSWDRALGFAIDPLARGASSDTNNFMAVLDPGDGSLFTRSIDEVDLPHFDEMLFAPGTTLDVNGNAYVASTISGLPDVVSTAADPLAAPSLTITNRFIVNAAELVPDPAPKMSLAMPLSFGETGGVMVTNLAAIAHGGSRVYTLAEVTGEGNEITATGSTPLRRRIDFGGESGWTVRVSDDGKRLELFPSGATILIFR